VAKKTRSKPKPFAIPATASEKDWQARSDANTLAEAKAIMADPARKAKAAEAAAGMADAKVAEARAMKSVARLRSK
jgi:hypothetical protein